MTARQAALQGLAAGRPQNLGPAERFAEPEPGVQGSREAVTVYCALAACLRAVLERCWPGSTLDTPDFVRCRSGLVLAFQEVSAALAPTRNTCQEDSSNNSAVIQREYSTLERKRLPKSSLECHFNRWALGARTEHFTIYEHNHTIHKYIRKLGHEALIRRL